MLEWSGVGWTRRNWMEAALRAAWCRAERVTPQTSCPRRANSAPKGSPTYLFAYFVLRGLLCFPYWHGI